MTGGRLPSVGVRAGRSFTTSREACACGADIPCGTLARLVRVDGTPVEWACSGACLSRSSVAWRLVRLDILSLEWTSPAGGAS